MIECDNCDETHDEDEMVETALGPIVGPCCADQFTPYRGDRHEHGTHWSL
jgi:hypothetical protein